MNKISKKKLSNTEYYSCIEDLISNPIVLQMDEFIQHGTTTTLDHCISVSYKSFRIAKLFKLNYKGVARAGLLHDFFLYDWHNTPKAKKFLEMHGYTHARTALNNALKHFELTNMEKDIISKHMWPLTLRNVPQYKESFLVSIVDKYSSCTETIPNLVTKLSNKSL